MYADQQLPRPDTRATEVHRDQGGNREDHATVYTAIDDAATHTLNTSRQLRTTIRLLLGTISRSLRSRSDSLDCALPSRITLQGGDPEIGKRSQLSEQLIIDHYWR